MPPAAYYGPSSVVYLNALWTFTACKSSLFQTLVHGLTVSPFPRIFRLFLVLIAETAAFLLALQNQPGANELISVARPQVVLAPWQR